MENHHPALFRRPGPGRPVNRDHDFEHTTNSDGLIRDRVAANFINGSEQVGYPDGRRYEGFRLFEEELGHFDYAVQRITLAGLQIIREIDLPEADVSLFKPAGSSTLEPLTLAPLLFSSTAPLDQFHVEYQERITGPSGLPADLFDHTVDFQFAGFTTLDIKGGYFPTLQIARQETVTIPSIPSADYREVNFSRKSVRFQIRVLT